MCLIVLSSVGGGIAAVLLRTRHGSFQINRRVSISEDQKVIQRPLVILPLIIFQNVIVTAIDRNIAFYVFIDNIVLLVVRTGTLVIR